VAELAGGEYTLDRLLEVYPKNPIPQGRDEAGRALAFILWIRRPRPIAHRDMVARSRGLQRINWGCCLILVLVLALVRGTEDL